ncbi:unnamed protein product [Cladocopium goreaui]|uniref:Uncharacterized protein n=1 Tax=Cladocopium goreaui TaxID=2562237 RepID=A0A9P1FH89_9DINO|nr:unnamed protein product [Cladocopium goreaui]
MALGFRELITKLTEAHEREVTSAAAKLREENSRLEKKVEDLQKQMGVSPPVNLSRASRSSRSSRTSRSSNQSCSDDGSREAPKSPPKTPPKSPARSRSGENDTSLVLVKPASKGERSQSGPLVSALKGRSSVTSLMSQSDQGKDLDRSKPAAIQVESLEVPSTSDAQPVVSPRVSFSEQQAGAHRLSQSSASPPNGGLKVSFGNLMGMSSKPSTPRAVLPWPPPGGTPGAARRNSSMISGLQLPRMGGGAGRRASAAGMSSVAMARRGARSGQKTCGVTSIHRDHGHVIVM